MIFRFVECLLIGVVLFIIVLVHDDWKHQEQIKDYLKQLKRRR